MKVSRRAQNQVAEAKGTRIGKFQKFRIDILIEKSIIVSFPCKINFSYIYFCNLRSFIQKNLKKHV
jgi:hypothetical protein